MNTSTGANLMMESPDLSTGTDVAVPTRSPRIVRARAPRLVALSRTECTRLLARNYVGRLAYAFRDAVDIVPLHYAYVDGWIYARTSPGQKLAKLRHNRWVAFEVDEVRGVFDWTSVVVHGGLYVLSPDGPEADASAWERAVELLRRLVPAAGTAFDPMPERTMVFRIHADEMT
ncbi:MAG TPA: pyridoxamine 5'-phosphate oxidase family protein, partial [Gemmatimonadaceae bacterium]|nr:pyridoxamine 5'-phosphate oxidase family protein [Gemmatimonadaceae bacterium]